MQSSLQEGHVTLHGLVLDAVETYFRGIYTCMPGAVVSFDEEDCSATVRPLIKVKNLKTNEIVLLPEVSKVPVQMPRTASSWVSLPMAKDDLVLLVFGQRSLDAWLAGNGSATYHDDDRRFALADAIAIPGVYPFSRPIKKHGSASSLELANGKSYIELKVNGTIKIANERAELIALVTELLKVLLEAKTQTALGPQTFLPDTLKALLEISKNLATLGG